MSDKMTPPIHHVDRPLAMMEKFIFDETMGKIFLEMIICFHSGLPGK